MAKSSPSEAVPYTESSSRQDHKTPLPMVKPAPRPSRDRIKRFAEFEAQVQRYRMEHGCQGKKLRVLDVGGRPDDWQCVYDVETNALNLHFSVLTLQGELHCARRFNCLVGEGLESLKCIPNQSFDICYSAGVLEILDDEEALMATLREMKRVAHCVHLPQV